MVQTLSAKRLRLLGPISRMEPQRIRDRFVYMAELTGEEDGVPEKDGWRLSCQQQLLRKKPEPDDTGGQC